MGRMREKIEGRKEEKWRNEGGRRCNICHCSVM